MIFPNLTRQIDSTATFKNKLISQFTTRSFSLNKFQLKANSCTHEMIELIIMCSFP